MRDDIVRDYLREQAAQPFAWGSSDCAHFAGGIIERLTGRNPCASYAYDSEEHARSLIAAAGGLAALVSRELGEPHEMRTDWKLIESGDVVYATYASSGEVLGVAFEGRAYYKRPGGLIPTRLDQVLKFWKVECRKY
jgi:hypothetical protein